MLKSFALAFRRECLMVMRNPAGVLNALWFYLLVSALFPIGLGPEPALLAKMAPGLIWVIALLAVMLSADTLFREDYADGSLEQLMLCKHPLYFMLLARLFAQSLFIALPMALLSPLLGLFLGLPMSSMWVCIASVLLGVPSLVFIGAIGAALTVGFERGSLLLSILILPLYIPVLIFASAAVQASVGGFEALPHLSILAALLCLAVALAPMAVLGALKLHFYY